MTVETTKDTFKFIIPTIHEQGEIGRLLKVTTDKGFTEIIFERTHSTFGHEASKKEINWNNY